MTEQIKRARQRETGIRVFLSACGVIAVSGIIRVYGLDDVIFFNKGAVSLGFFFLCFFLAGIYDNLGCVETFAMNVKFPKEDLL